MILYGFQLFWYSLSKLIYINRFIILERIKLFLMQSNFISLYIIFLFYEVNQVILFTFWDILLQFP